MVSPSGLTSSEIQLPSVMSRGTSRSTSRGRPVSSDSSPASSSPADCAGAGLGPRGSAAVTPDTPIDADSTSSRTTTVVEPGSAPLAMRKRLRRGREPESRVGMRIVVFSFGVAGMVSTRRLERHAPPSLTPEVEWHRPRTRPRGRESRWMRPAAEEPITTCRATCDRSPECGNSPNRRSTDCRESHHSGRDPRVVPCSASASTVLRRDEVSSGRVLVQRSHLLRVSESCVAHGVGEHSPAVDAFGPGEPVLLDRRIVEPCSDGVSLLLGRRRRAHPVVERPAGRSFSVSRAPRVEHQVDDVRVSARGRAIAPGQRVCPVLGREVVVESFRGSRLRWQAVGMGCDHEGLRGRRCAVPTPLVGCLSRHRPHPRFPGRGRQAARWSPVLVPRPSPTLGGVSSRFAPRAARSTAPGHSGTGSGAMTVRLALRILSWRHVLIFSRGSAGFGRNPPGSPAMRRRRRNPKTVSGRGPQDAASRPPRPPPASSTARRPTRPRGGASRG